MSKIGQYVSEFNDDLINMSFDEFASKHANGYPNKDENELKELRKEWLNMREELFLQLRTVTN